MAGYHEVQKTITVPKGAGIDGYLEALRTILKRPRVQDVHLKADGTVTYRRFAHEEEPEDPLTAELETLMPYHVLTRVSVVELLYEQKDAAQGIGLMFDCAAADGLAPIGFTSGDPNPLNRTSTLNGTIYGYPLWVDPQLPREVLILLAAYTRDSALMGAQKAYKITLPVRR